MGERRGKIKTKLSDQPVTRAVEATLVTETVSTEDVPLWRGSAVTLRSPRAGQPAGAAQGARVSAKPETGLA